MYYTVDSYYDVNTKITDVDVLKFIPRKDLLRHILHKIVNYILKINSCVLHV
jgi:hypothetical protein